MKSFLKKSALVLCGLLLSIIIIGQFFPQTERTAASPVVAEKVLVPRRFVPQVKHQRHQKHGSCRVPEGIV